MYKSACSLLHAGILVFSISLPLHGGRSLVTSSTGTVMLPPGPPYNALTDTRLEVRLTNIQPCQAVITNEPHAGYVQNWFRIAGNANQSVNIFALGCRTVGQWGIYESAGTASSPTEYLSPAEAEGKTDLIFRMQKDQSNQRYTVEIWTPDGVRIKEFTSPSGVHRNPAMASPNQSRFIRGGGSVQIAWMRWYTGVVPLNSAMPKDTGAESGDLGNWEFDGNLEDSSGRGLNVNMASCASGNEGCFAESPVYAPVLQLRAQNAVAGRPLMLDGSVSFTWDGSTLEKVRWSQVSGPTRVRFSDQESLTPTVTGHVAGNYVFELAIPGGPSKQIAVAVANTDSSGLPIYPVAKHHLAGTAQVEFDMSAVPGAVEAVVTVKKPDGRNLPPVLCTASPCTVQIDGRQRDHLYLIEFRDAAGEVVQTTDWETLTNPEQMFTTGAVSSGESWNRFGFYLLQNWPSWVGTQESARSADYFSKRMWLGVDGVPIVARSPGMWTQARYIDGRAVYNYEIGGVQDVADKYGWNHEDMLLHMSRNHRWMSSTYRWTIVDRFDAFERAGGAYTNGVLLGDAAETPAVFVERSDAAYSTAVGDVVLTPQSPVLYIGYGEPFAEATFVLAAPAAGCSTMWEYWNGSSWAELPLRSSGPQNGLAGDGKVEWLPPSNWQRKVVRTSRNKWWLRVRTAGCSTFPSITRILADNWEAATDPLMPITLTSNSGAGFSGTAPDEGFRENTHGLHYYFTPNQDCSGRPTLNVNGWGARPLLEEDGATPMNCRAGQTYLIWYRWEGHWRKRSVDNKVWRGWCESSPTRINIGLGVLEFDPTPPPQCEAKFRYQARILFGWAPNNTSGNFTYVQHGQNTFARYVVDASLPHLTRGGEVLYNGIFLDDLSPDQPSDNACVAPNGRPLLATELGRHSFNYELDSIAVHVRKAREYLRETHPDFYVGINSGANWVTQHEADWVLMELANWGSGPRPVTGFNPDPYHWEQGIDRYRPEHNPRGVKGLYTSVDSSSETSSGGQWVPWDRGNRGPITNWAGYLLVSNENVGWFYCPNGAAYYTSTDEYLYWEEQPDAELTEELAADPRTGVKTLRGNFAGWPAGTYRIRIGETGEFRNITKVAGNNHEVTTAEPVYNHYGPGTRLWRLKQGRLSMNAPPPAERVFRWGYYFPAMDIDVGAPDKEGHKGGERDLSWISARDSGTCCGVARRDFTRAIVLQVEARNATAAQYATYSNPIDLGGTYYPLRADGTTGPGVTSIQLRSGEGAILMKEPVY